MTPYLPEGPRVKAVLFDLDGTLLDIDIEPFLRDYFGLLGPVVAELIDAQDPAEGLRAIIRGTQAMSLEHPCQSNEVVFNRAFREVTGIDLSDGIAAERIAAFYRQAFPSLQGSHGPRSGAREAYTSAREAGLKVALATNPIFPRAAIEERARWAGFRLSEFDHVTSYENSHACKPLAAYFAEVAEALGTRPADCLMVGDDPVLDLGAAATGMSTFYVGPDAQVVSTWSGDLFDFASLISSWAVA